MPVRQFKHLLTDPKPHMGMDTIVFGDHLVTMKLYQHADDENPTYPEDKTLKDEWEDWVGGDQRYWFEAKIYAAAGHEPVALNDAQKHWVAKIVNRVKLRDEGEMKGKEDYSTISSVSSVHSPGGTLTGYTVETHNQITYDSFRSLNDMTDYTQ